MDTSLDALAAGAPVGGASFVATAGARTAPVGTSFGSALAGALEGGAPGSGRATEAGVVLVAAGPNATGPNAGGLTPTGSGQPDGVNDAPSGASLAADVLAMARAVAIGNTPAVTPRAAACPAKTRIHVAASPASGPIGQAAPSADLLPESDAAAVAPAQSVDAEPLNPPADAAGASTEPQSPFETMVLADALPVEVPPVVTTAAAYLSGETPNLDRQTGSTPQVQTDGLDASVRSSAGVAVPAGAPSGAASIVVAPGSARQDAAVPGSVREDAAAPGSVREQAAAPIQRAEESTFGQESVSPVTETPTFGTRAADQSVGDRAAQVSSTASFRAPQPDQHSVTAERGRVAAGRIGFDLPDVPLSGALPAVADGATQTGDGRDVSLAAGIRASLVRALSPDVSQSVIRPGTGGDSTRLVPGPLSFVSDAGNASVFAPGADLTGSQAAVAGAERMSFQIASQLPIESPLWARNELAKAARWAQDNMPLTPLAVAAVASSTGGQTSLSASADRGFDREPSALAAHPSGLATGLGAALGPGAGVTTTQAFSVADRSDTLTPEPTTEAGPLVPSIVRVMKLQWTEGGGEVQLRLRPEHLGELTVALRVEAGAVSATLRSDSPLVRAWIEQHQQDLRTGLRDSGLTLERLSVDPDGRQRDQSRNDVYQPEPRAYPKRQVPATQFEALI